MKSDTVALKQYENKFEVIQKQIKAIEKKVEQGAIYSPRNVSVDKQTN